MYRINKKENTISKIEEKKFSELGFREREHLQEWIADNPEVLGEELLIIQKEFNGFDQTNERLDLLALDKDGDLVIIENKLDDSGRDVTWQALKYASYCSTLTTAQIIVIYQEYLDKLGVQIEAKNSILEFLDLEEEELLINQNDQKIIFVANNFRKEVTSTVLWLIQHDLKIKCFKAVPFAIGNDLFLDINQIIPLPETNDYIISAKNKSKEKSERIEKQEERNRNLIAFWSEVNKQLCLKGFKHFEHINPSAKTHFGGKIDGGYYYMCMGRWHFRVELYFSRDPDRVQLDAMLKFKEDIERKIPNILFENKEGKIATKLKVENSSDEYHMLTKKWKSSESWDYPVNWFADNMISFFQIVSLFHEKTLAQNT